MLKLAFLVLSVIHFVSSVVSRLQLHEDASFSVVFSFILVCMLTDSYTKKWSQIEEREGMCEKIQFTTLNKILAQRHTAFTQHHRGSSKVMVISFVELNSCLLVEESDSTEAFPK